MCVCVCVHYRLKFSCEQPEDLAPASAKKKKLSVEPAAQQERVQALHQVCVCVHALIGCQFVLFTENQ